MKYRGWGYIDHMVQTCEELFVCMEGINSANDLSASIVTRRAVVMCLLDLGEMFKNLTDKELGEYPSEHWHKVIGFRNRSAHGYSEMNFEYVYQIVINRIPPLYNFLKKKADSLEDPYDNV
ncbi:MAG: DUF86 domain-containing protein [Oscillospiraceae bacterium]|nr:DUF86 domain-containing protein [Oscillospiraceae bacterium]